MSIRLAAVRQWIGTPRRVLLRPLHDLPTDTRQGTAMTATPATAGPAASGVLTHLPTREWAHADAESDARRFEVGLHFADAATLAALAGRAS
jgi:hypothetical protein